MKILVTGCAGFIGYHTVKKLIGTEDVSSVVGLDNINNYYARYLKYSRLSQLGIPTNKIEYSMKTRSIPFNNFSFVYLDMCDKEKLVKVFEKEKFTHVCHLAAQAGVRYSMENPETYIDSNITGFFNIIECCRMFNVKHFVYASSSSVYGLNSSGPFSTKENTSHPVSLYAATKKSNELFAHTYSHLYNLPTTGLRFFTVYGPWGRPDMAYFKFTKAILEGEPIDLYNNGNMIRDFTYIDDVTESISRILKLIPQRNDSWSGVTPDPSCSSAPYKIYNIGSHNPVALSKFVEIIEKELPIDANKNYLLFQKGDIYATYADVSDLVSDIDFKPNTTLEEGIHRFVSWYRWYYKI